MNLSATTIVLSFVIIFHVAQGATFISNALGSHMVLQREPQRANIWGWATAGDKVTVVINQKTYTATATATGAWTLFLDPTPAGGPYTLTADSSSGLSAKLEDILFGDIYVCSGQSNMELAVGNVFNATDEIALANKYPNIRLFTVGTGTTSTTPLEEFLTIAQPWSVASSATVGGFSAACWFYGRDLYDDIKVPQGLFNDNWGGTPIQSWSSPDALHKCNATETHVEPPKSGVTGPYDSSQLWNAMIVPILPMSIRGATWYQGESNTLIPGQANYYACAFPAMIADWRAKWGGDTEKTFGFYFVQLAPWLSGDNDSQALVRLSQMYATALPLVGVATAMDWGDPSSPTGSVKPRYKQIVGYRLHLLARGITYGEKVQYKGPEATDHKVIHDSPSAQVQVNFAPDSIGSGLVLQPKQCDEGVPLNQCGWFDIGTADGKWTNATAEIIGDSILVSAITPSSPVTGVRYAWANYPVATLYNKEGLPTLPFAFPNPIKPTYQ